MPNNPPPTVPQSFLTAVAALTWGGSHLVQLGVDAPVYPSIRGTNPGVWDLANTGASLTHATYLGLCGATANSDGSYTDAAGATWFLREVSGWATPSTT